jgi:hypothetical protein
VLADDGHVEKTRLRIPVRQLFAEIEGYVNFSLEFVI